MNTTSIAQNIVQGNFDKDLFLKEYNQGTSASQLYDCQELSKEVSYLMKEAIINSSDNQKQVTLTNTLTNVNDFILSLTDSDFSFALNEIKNKLSTIPQLCTLHRSNYQLNYDIRDNIAIIISKNENCTDNKREILIKCITDFDKPYLTDEPVINKLKI